MIKLSVKIKILAALAATLTLFISIMLIIMLFKEENLKHKQTNSFISELSYSIIQSIVFIMDQGADDVAPIVKEVSKIENIKDLRVFPTDLINEAKAAKMDSLERKVVKSKQKIEFSEVFASTKVHRAIEPILATESCTNCHASNVGDALAVISLRYSTQETEESISSQRIFGTAMLILIVICAMIMLYFLLNKMIFNDLDRSRELIEELASGNIDTHFESERTDEIGKLINAIGFVKHSIKLLIDDAKILSEAASSGKISTRADSAAHKGSFAKIIEGMNETLNGVAEPLSITADYIDRISKGDVPDKINIDFKGDFNEIKININQCIDSINLLLKDTYNLVDSATIGKLNDRALPYNHSGDYQKLINGVNSMLDRLVGLIDNLPMPVQIVDRDYNIVFINKIAKNIENEI